MVSELSNGISSGRILSDDLEIMVPLFVDEGDEKNYLGAVILLLEGDDLLEEFEVLDSQLLSLCGILLLLGGGLIAFVLQVTFRRMEVANRLLEERGQRLAAANEKLLLASKTSAVGSLTANLVHGLKNPLGSLKEFVSYLRETQERADEEDLDLASESVRRMQDLIQDTLSVMQSSEGEAAFSFSLNELKQEILKKLTPIAKNQNVNLVISDRDSECEIDSVRGNLLVLIICNLGQNAIEATSQQKEVSIKFSISDKILHCLVSDDGEGLPARMKEDPFQTIRSDKKGGSGIGLALSHQLAQQMEAELILESSSDEGTIFKFSLRLA